MNCVQLGTTDLRVSRIGFGCWQLSRAFWGDTPIDRWRRAVEAAIASGINFFDTADVYGNGYAETELGRVLSESGLRDRIVLATKFFWSVERQPRHPDTRHDYILRACENSLRRLRTDRIDLYQIHAWDALTRPDEVAAALLRLRREGKIRWIGVSNLNTEQMRLYGAYVDVSCLQPGYSLLQREVEACELPYCLANRIGVIPYSPLYSGLLTGKYAPDHIFTDMRAQNPLFQGARFAAILKALQHLKPLAELYGLDLPQFSVRWVLTHPAVTSAIVGIKDETQIMGILPAANGVLEQADWYTAANAIERACENNGHAG